MSEVAELRRRVRDLESRDPLRNNDVLVRAVEQALQLMAIRKFGAVQKAPGGLLRREDYLRRFISLALNPNITRAEMCKMLKINKNTLDKHLYLFTGYLNDFVDDAHLLRTSDVGYGWARDYDLEEQ